MKSNFLITIISIFLFSKAFAENLSIEAKNITLDKKNNTTIFQDQVTISTESKHTFKSDYVEYNKKTGFLKLKNNVIAKDNKGNLIKTNYAEYFQFDKIFKTTGPTYISTPENYKIESSDILFDNKKRLVSSKKKSNIIDADNNKINLENFEYLIDSNIFKSIGLIEFEDKNDNTYEFSQIYIDTKKKEVLGTDIKAYLNQDIFKINEKNKPRIFANTVRLNNNQSSFEKGIFTLCDYRKKDKCPPWTIQSSKMLHDRKKKTIYYNNAVVKVYDIPIFFTPKLSHPDPTVDRRSGFLNPTLSDTKNLGEGIAIPYFFDLGRDKNFTLTNRLYVSENPLFLGEYHQEFKNTTLLTDFGYTEGYKKTSSIKKAGNKSHFFSKISSSFKNNNSENKLDLTLQHVSNDKYLKLYRIDSNLVDYNADTIENSVDFTHESENLFLGFETNIYETLKESYDDKYEYILPEITLDKNLLNNEKIGILDLSSNYKVHNYDTNKLTNFLVNNFNWNSRNISFNNGLNTKFLGNFKNINYEAKNVDIYKNNFTSEIFGALGVFSELKLQKLNNNSKHLFTPKALLRFAPGSMRKETDGSRLETSSAFNINRLDNQNNFETGLTGTLGFDYKVESKDKRKFDFSIAQIVSQKENKKMASITSLDEKLSDLVGSSSLKLNENFTLNYNFALDQNYSELNYNDIGTSINFGPSKIDFSYLQEQKHIGHQEYFKTKIDISNRENGLFSFETKRNLITNSADFYNLSYEYINDCLRAGLVYRREFYNDSELEPENSLMFKITLTPFGNINSPSFSQ